MVNRSGWVAAGNADGFESVMSRAALTAMRRILAADFCPCDAQKRQQKEYPGPNRTSAVCGPETTPLVDVISR
jgi:hypothetical protein